MSRPRKKKVDDITVLADALSTASGYATVKLGMKPHPTQAAVMDSVFSAKRTRTSFLCGNSIGKTSVVAATCILYGLDILGCRVISTAAVFRQITEQLIPNLKAYAHLFPAWRFLDNAISINGVNQYLGVASTSEGDFQGFHGNDAKKLLLIVDEASAVQENIFRAIDRCNADYLLVMGSPLDPAGVFYDIRTNPKFKSIFNHFHLSQLQCLKKDGYWIDDTSIDEMVLKWGRYHPLVLSSIYGEFATDSENSIITLSAYEKCINSPPKYIPNPNIKRVGIDFAAGRAESVMFLLEGNRTRMLKSWKDKDTMQTVGKMVVELNNLKRDIGLVGIDIEGDADGLGLPMIDRLKELGWNINRFHGNSPPVSEEYKNRITESWIEGCRKIRNCEIILPEDNELKMQILSRQQKLNSSGKLQLESKEDMAARGIQSPDRADSLFMALCASNSGEITFIRTPPRREKQYSFA